MQLVVQTAFLGDMILTTPLLEQLAKRGPVDVVATPANAGILANHPAVRDVIVFDKRGAHRGVGGLRKIARAIRFRDAKGVIVPRNVQVAYMAQGSARSAALARMARVPRVVGFDSSSGRWLYTERVAYDSSRHHVDRLLSLAGIHATSPGAGASTGGDVTARPSLHPGALEHDAVRQLLERAGVAHDESLIVLAPGSVWATKRWPSFSALAAHLAAAYPTQRVVVTGSPADSALAAEISRAVGDAGGRSVIDATGKLSLLGTAALMQRAEVVVSNDSAPLHLASAMNAPTVALFGPTIPGFGFGPLAERRTVVEHTSLPCRPCHSHGPAQCPLGHWRCMRELDMTTVASAVASVRRS